MKKLLALMMALAMLLSCTGALAETTAVDEASEAPVIKTPLNIYSETDIDREALATDLTALGQDESFLLKADTVAAVLTEAAERLTIVDNGFQWDLLLGGKDIFTVAAEITDEGFTMGSNLFPNYVFKFSNEELNDLAKAVSAQYEEQNKAMERIDVNALARAVGPIFENYLAASLAAFEGGESQRGDFKVNDVSYNTMVPVEMDVAAFANALTQLEQDLLADPTVAVTLAQFDRSGKITKSVEKTIDPANAPAVHLEFYTNTDEAGNQSGPMDTTFTVTMPGKKDPDIKGDVWTDGEDVTANVQFLNADINMVLSSRKTENGHVHKADLNVNGLYFGCVADVGENDQKYNDTEIFFLDPENSLISQRSTMTHENGLTFDLSQGTPITLSDLKGKDSSVLAGLSTDVMLGLASIATAASEALPEEVSAMLALFSLSSEG